MKYNDTIQHFGVKGMKWGHRNRRDHLMNKYLSKGYDTKSAAAKTEKRLKIEKSLNTAAIIGGAALGTYLGYKGHQSVSRYLDKNRLQKVKDGLKKMNSIRESNSKVKRSKFSKIADAVKEAHRKDTERFTSKFDTTMLKNAAKKASKSNKDSYADNILRIAQQKPGILGRRKTDSIDDTKRKISKIADNFAKAKRKMNSTSKNIDSIDTQALKTFKNLMKKR